MIMSFFPTKSKFDNFLNSHKNEPKEKLDMRNTAFERMNKIGLPSINDENWQFTKLSKLLKTEYDITDSDLSIDVDSISAKYRLDGFDTLIFINGKIDRNNSQFSKYILVEDNVENCNIKDENNPFILMNYALCHDGFSLKIDSNYNSEKPLHILNIYSSDVDFVQYHIANKIDISPNCEIAIIEENVHIDDNHIFVNTVNQFDIGKNSFVDFTSIQKYTDKVSNLNYKNVSQDSGSKLNYININIGGELVRNEIIFQLNGENCYSYLSGLSLLENRDHIENYTFVHHNLPHSHSNQLFKYILRDKSEGVFNGLVSVKQDAQNTNSKQSNKNLLLSKNAVIYSNPQLEIYADDVSCAHGSATGELDDDAIFYLRSRGIDLKAAQSLLIEGFAKEVTNNISNASFKQRINKILLEWLNA